jgi:alkanesulfonate monooxygenase SsuD/methylene tetrahydromethanopterin reductase-like flavin-dependent oxidoreductase (luciferase family)
METNIVLPQTGKHASPEAIACAVQKADRLGYATVWVLEMLLRPVNTCSRSARLEAKRGE